jgi:transposase, IS6 family
MILERGLQVDQTTIFRWVQRSAPELEKRCRPHLNANNDSWKVDETSLKIRKVCFSLSRAVDSTGDTLEFLHAPNTRCRGSKELLAQSLAVLGSFRFSSMPRPGTGHPAPSGIGLSRRSIGSSRDHWG